MTDRELLEAAARAYWRDEIDDVCSIRWLDEDQAIGYTHADNQDHNGIDREFVWNPLTDDGDALRLANALRINIEHAMSKASGSDAFVGCQPRDYGHFAATEDDLSDYNAATRRAITRAAAALSEQEVSE